MKFKEYLLRTIIPTYFMLVTFLTLFIWAAGTLLEPDRLVGYDVLLSPLVYGVIGIIPSFLCYSKREFSFRKELLRHILHFLLLTSFILGFSLWKHVIQSWQEAAAIFFAVCIIYLGINLILWKHDQRLAKQISAALANLEDEG